MNWVALLGSLFAGACFINGTVEKDAISAIFSGIGWVVLAVVAFETKTVVR